MKTHLACFFLAILLLTSACSPSPARKTAWQSAHLRALDPADAVLHTQDLLAFYTQSQGDLLWLRLDLLEVDDLPNFDLYLAFDWKSGGSHHLPVEADSHLAWDTLLIIPARGSIQFLAPDGEGEDFEEVQGYRVLVFRDPIQDMLEVRLQPIPPADERAEITCLRNFRLEVFLSPPDSTQVADRLDPLSLNAPPPLPVPTLLAFWNTMPAYTPRQALRRWDGAHSGPSGGRHGLSGLLQAAERTRSPLFLLDLNQPASLSAMQLVGANQQVQSLTQNDLLYLPQVIPALPHQPELNPPTWVVQEFLDQDRATSQRFGMNPSAMDYLPAGDNLLGSLKNISHRSARTLVWVHTSRDQALSNGLPFQSWLNDLQNFRLIYLPSLSPDPPQHQQATPDGLGLESRLALIQAAIRAQEHPFNSELMILGGDLTHVNWGNPQMARATLNYIQNHPWINLLTLDELRQMIFSPVSTHPMDAGTGPTWQPSWLEELRRAPLNPITQAAWQAYRAFYNRISPDDPALGELRAHFSGQIAVLLQAAHWADQPQSLASCSEDPDQDGQVECQLASEQVFAIIELDLGGYVSFLFVRDQQGAPHQLVAPSSLLISGLSPPSTWDLNQGILADPRVLPGAFLETPIPGGSRPSTMLQDHQVILDIADRSIHKIFRLLPAGIELALQDTPPGQAYSLSAALTLDPWQRFQPGWEQGYQIRQSARSWDFLAPDGIGLELITHASLSAQSTFDHLERLRRPENPDQDIPPGQMIPFPMAIVELDGTTPFSVALHLLDRTVDTR